MARKPRLATRQKAVATKPRLPDPKKAKAYFEAKMAWTTGPVELIRNVQEGGNIQVEVER